MPVKSESLPFPVDSSTVKLPRQSQTLGKLGGGVYVCPKKPATSLVTGAYSPCFPGPGNTAVPGTPNTSKISEWPQVLQDGRNKKPGYLQVRPLLLNPKTQLPWKRKDKCLLAIPVSLTALAFALESGEPT